MPAEQTTEPLHVVSRREPRGRQNRFVRLPDGVGIDGNVAAGARAIVLDADDRVLLLRYDENGGFFSAPVKPASAPVTFGTR
ncbi:hypothetical protein [Streptomyces sp. NPDC046862]|uniref:hypothetical protein n=1 Tax=Streptomyces sp. NPDC046862 TaxID=3154603 RepID=UPI003454C0B7